MSAFMLKLIKPTCSFLSYHLQRPAEAESRARLGDWEADTVAGVAGGACLVTLVDRKSGYLVGGKCAKKASAQVNKVMIRALRRQPRHTVTPDRGKEFAAHAEAEEALNRMEAEMNGRILEK